MPFRPQDDGAFRMTRPFKLKNGSTQARRNTKCRQKNDCLADYPPNRGRHTRTSGINSTQPDRESLGQKAQRCRTALPIFAVAHGAAVSLSRFQNPSTSPFGDIFAGHASPRTKHDRRPKPKSLTPRDSGCPTSQRGDAHRYERSPLPGRASAQFPCCLDQPRRHGRSRPGAAEARDSWQWLPRLRRRSARASGSIGHRQKRIPQNAQTPFPIPKAPSLTPTSGSPPSGNEENERAPSPFKNCDCAQEPDMKNGKLGGKPRRRSETSRRGPSPPPRNTQMPIPVPRTDGRRLASRW